MRVAAVLLNSALQRDKSGRTPLWFAACNGRTEIVRALLDAGADKDRASIDGSTPTCTTPLPAFGARSPLPRTRRSRGGGHALRRPFSTAPQSAPDDRFRA